MYIYIIHYSFLHFCVRLCYCDEFKIDIKTAELPKPKGHLALEVFKWIIVIYGLRKDDFDNNNIFCCALSTYDSVPDD